VKYRRNFTLTRDLDYRCDDVTLRGYVAWNDDASGPRSGVLMGVDAQPVR
jgi:hypothetical protein